MFAMSFISNSAMAAALPTSDSVRQIIENIEQKSDFIVTDRVVADLEHSLEVNPNDSSAHLALGLCYDKLGMMDLATREYQKAADQAPDDPRALMELVKSQVRHGQTKPAMTILKSAYERFPNDPETMFWYANYLRTTDKSNEAEALYKKALTTNKNVLGLGSAVAELRMQQGRYGDAVVMANKDLALDKNFGLANELKGAALLRMQQYAAAVEPLRIAYEQAPTKRELAAQYSYASYWTGAYRNALEPALINLAMKSSLTTNSQSAKEAVRRVMSKLPASFCIEKISSVSPIVDKEMRNAAFHFSLGDVLDSLGMYEPAIEQYSAGLMIAPNFARGIFRLGKDLELHRHEYEEALVCYKKAHALAPDDQEIEAHLNRLNARYPRRSGDFAWQLKDWIRGIHPENTKGN